MTSGHLALRALAAMALALLIAVPPPAAAQAQGSRSWHHSALVDGAWQVVTDSPDTSTPGDGTVEGWRLAVTEDDEPRYPREALTFAEVCGEVEPTPDRKRVAVVLDYGRPVDAPDGEQPPDSLARCAALDPDASSLDALRTVVPEVRTDDAGGVVCGVDGYPESGCDEPVREVGEEAREADEPAEITVITTDVVDEDDSTGPTGSTKAAGGVPVWAWLLAGLAVVAGLLLLLRAGTRLRDAEHEEHRHHDPEHEDEDSEHI